MTTVVALYLLVLILLNLAVLVLGAAIYQVIRPRLSATLRIHIRIKKGPLVPMPNLRVGQSFHAVFQEFSGPNGTGHPLPPAGPVKFASSDTAVATVDPDSGVGVTVAAGTAVITGSDAADSLSASDTLIGQESAQSATLNVVGD